MNEPNTTTIFLRPIGTPVALGLSGLVAASLVASGLELGWVSAGERPLVAIVFLAFAFPLQGLASILAFLARDGAVGTAMGVLAGTWLATGLTYLATPPGSTSDTLGLLLLAAGGLLAAAAAAAASGKLVPAAVFATEALRFALIALYELSGAEVWQNLGGVVGLVVVALAGYAMLAAVLEGAHGRTVLPLGRRGGRVEREPGVRAQL
jgi:succinate-acetate transporter protein